MRSFKAAAFQYFVLISALFSACSSETAPKPDQNQASPNSTPSVVEKQANDNAEELGMIVNLPLEPIEAFWREDLSGSSASSDGAGRTRRLIAVVRYSAAEANKFAAEAKKHGEPVPVELEALDWYPTELIAQSEMGGSKLKGMSYKANDLLKAPYSEGRITRVDETDYFVLELIAK